MSLLDRDIPSAGQTCSRCNILFGQGVSRGRRPLYDQDQSSHNESPPKITVFINPSKRPYVAPFRRVQTLERLLQYISTLPHPQIRFATNANPAKPAFQACEEMLYAGQWQLVDSLGCIIRPEDYEELIHNRMDITVDTIPYEQPEEQNAVLQPMVMSRGKSIQRNGHGSQLERNEVAGDFFDIQINGGEPVTTQHTHSQSEASVAQYPPSGVFVPSFEETSDMNELEGGENPESQAPSRSVFVMPPKPISWAALRKGAMSASAAEFKPGSVQPSPLPLDNPLLHLRQATEKRSMAIPIIRPSSPALTVVPALKPDEPITSNDDDDYDDRDGVAMGDGNYDGWISRTSVTSSQEQIPIDRETMVSKSHGWENQTAESSVRTEDETSRSFIITDEKPIEKSQLTQVSESGYASDTINGQGFEERQEQLHNGSSPIRSQISTPKQVEVNSNYLGTNSRNASVEPEAKFEDESHLFDDDIPEASEAPEKPIEIVSTEEQPSETPLEKEGLDEKLIDDNLREEEEKATEEGEQKNNEIVHTAKPSSADMLAALMSGTEFKPIHDTEPQPSNGDFQWDEQQEDPPQGEPSSSNPLDPKTNSWDTPSWGEDSHATSGGAGWGDWSTAHDTVIEEGQWDNRGHVPRDSDGDAEWGPPEPKKPTYTNDPKPIKPAWSKVSGVEWPSRPSAATSGPAVAPAPAAKSPATLKKGITIIDSGGRPIIFPPRPGSSKSTVNILKPKKNTGFRYIYFVPSSNCRLPNPTIGTKMSIVEGTTVRKLAQMYAKHYKEFQLLSFANNLLQNPILELSISKSEDGAVTTHVVEGDRKLMDCDFGTEFWVSIVYLGSRASDN